MAEFREESEQHVVHRLEAFADIIIGFSLAQMTLNVSFPADALLLFTTQRSTLFAFGLSFVVVAGMWWSHHRLFASYFVPTPLNIALIFCSLGGVMFLVFSLEVWLHAARHHYVAYAMYAGAIAWVVAIAAFLTYRGTLLRGRRMAPRLVRLGRRRAIGMSVTAIVFACLAVASASSRSVGHIQGWTMVGAVLVVLLLRLIERRIDAKEA